MFLPISTLSIHVDESGLVTVFIRHLRLSLLANLLNSLVKGELRKMLMLKSPTMITLSLIVVNQFSSTCMPARSRPGGL